MPDIPRTLAQQCKLVTSNESLMQHIYALSEACDALRLRSVQLEAELAAVRALIAKPAQTTTPAPASNGSRPLHQHGGR
jgi:hypothetical protein